MTNTTAKPGKAPRTDMPCQAPEVRAHNFNEVALGYTDEMALTEAGRCMNCKKPLCRTGCPVEVHIPEFIAQVKAGNILEAYKILKGTNSLPAVCGRVCPQERQCESKCILGKKGQSVAIGRLERYVADTAMKMIEESGQQPEPVALKDDLKVACIGSGPSSLTVAGYLSARGIKVDVFEALHEPGGVLVYGIPAFRLPKTIVAAEVNGMRRNHVDFNTNYIGGRTVTVQGLLDSGYKAVFIGVGAGLPLFLNVPGENLIGVFSANEFLTRTNLGRGYDFPNYDTPLYPGKHVTIFGAGNVAMDAARTALRLGAETSTLMYRRTRAEMPARQEEIEHALEEGVKLQELVAPLRFNADENGHLKSVTVQRMELGEPDASGRRSPKPIAGAIDEFDTDLAIVALGTRSNPLLLDSTPGLELTSRKYIVANEETGETSIPNVFAGGDIVTGAATVILAMGAGRRSAREIARRLLGEEAAQ